MSKELYLTQNQLEDAVDIIDSSVTAALGDRNEFYDPSQQELPRPNYIEAIHASYGDQGAAFLQGGEFDASDYPDLSSEAWHNMRAAVGMVSSDNRIMWLPGTILPGGRLAYLEVDSITNPASHGVFSDIQHNALDNAFLTDTSNAGHETGGTAAVTNAAESKHGLVLASSMIPNGIHDAVHQLDSGDFTTAAGEQGRHDIAVKGRLRQIRPRVITMQQAHSLVIRPEFQMPTEKVLPFNLDVTPQQLLIAGTLAAARSRQQSVDIKHNLTSMVEAAQ